MLIRRDALETVGGFKPHLTEDFKLTLRLYLAGYKILYREDISVPAEPPSRIRDVASQHLRWSQGITESFLHHAHRILNSNRLSRREKLDLFLFGTFHLQAILFLAGTILALTALHQAPCRNHPTRPFHNTSHPTPGTLSPGKCTSSSLQGRQPTPRPLDTLRHTTSLPHGPVPGLRSLQRPILSQRLLAQNTQNRTDNPTYRCGTAIRPRLSVFDRSGKFLLPEPSQRPLQPFPKTSPRTPPYQPLHLCPFRQPPPMISRRKGMKANPRVDPRHPPHLLC